jgi:hypothetical protein
MAGLEQILDLKKRVEQFIIGPQDVIGRALLVLF